MGIIMVKMLDMTCGTCGVAYSIPESLFDSGNWYHCPNGHRWQKAPTLDPKDERIVDLEAKVQGLERRAEYLHETYAVPMWTLPAPVWDGALEAVKEPKHFRKAFWSGFFHAWSGLNRYECCPYPSNRGGYQNAWYRGYDAVVDLGVWGGGPAIVL